MSTKSLVTVRWTMLVMAAAVLVAVGASATYVGLQWRRPSRGTMPGASAPATAPTPEASLPVPVASASLPDVVITLRQETIERAGITVTTVAAGTVSGALRAPGVVEPNAYKQVAVTPLIGGRILRVAVELGQHVRKGQTLAQVFSPELAESQTRYISARAELEAHEQELARTEKLVQIGAASRQELERLHAGHTARRAEVESAASRLQLLRMSATAIEGLRPGTTLSATTDLPAPIAGVVTERLANVGLNVDPATKLFTLVDLSTVWVVAHLYEKDFARVRVGSPATITTSAYPDLTLRGRVSYIDPQVSAQTRTAKVRIEVPNARSELRLGMYAEVVLGGEDGASMTTVPRSAVQNVGDRTVVYLSSPNEPGRFVEREVHLGPVAGERVAVQAGVEPGDVIVERGSFYVRAERERLGLRPPVVARGTAGPPVALRHGPMDDDTKAQQVKVTVIDEGFEPRRLAMRAGIPARLTFTRTSDKTCATAVVFPTLNIRRELPLNTPVTIDFTPEKTGEIAFVCGMNMLSGTVVVQ